ncbi:MAG: hypothetical protein ACJ765_10200, partial [Chloroflexota bacterium]
PVGTTTVRCSAADAAGNSTLRSFTVTVTLDQPVPPASVYEVQWGEPISGGTLSANQGRSVPLKFRLFVNGLEKTTGSAVLSIAPCAGGPVAMTVPLSFGGGRWSGKLDTSGLNSGCYTATLVVDGNVAGSFTLDLRGADPAPASKPSPKPKN